jgi:protein TonB
MNGRRIPLEQAAAVGISIAVHAIAVWGLISHKPAPALAPEQAVIVSLVEAPPHLEPVPPSAASVSPSPRHRQPASAARPVSAPTAQFKAPTPLTDLASAPVAVSAPPLSPSPPPVAGRPIAPAPIAISKPAADPLIDYRRRVWAHLAAHAPSAPSGSGVVQVMFGLDESGMILFLRLVRSSGHPTFDRACLASIRTAQPLPPPPPGIGRDDLVFEVPITAAERSERH